MDATHAQSLAEVLLRLEKTIEARKAADPASSYTAQLLSDRPRAARKFGEEAVETIVAALGSERSAVVLESADVLYHLMVLLAASGVSLQEVAEVLGAREGRSGLEEKAARG